MHELALRPAGTASIRRFGLTKPFYSRFVPAISLGRLPRSTSEADLERRARLPGGLPCLSTREQVGDLAIVLHSHMPYVEGFGTYPFGEEWLFDAVARSYLPVLRPGA